MKFRAKNRYWYTPDIDNNLSLPPGKQLRGLIDRPDAETREELSYTEVSREYSKKEVVSIRSGKLPGNEDPKRETTVIRRKQDTGRILRDHVLQLVNAEVEEEDENGKVTTISLATGAELAKSKAFGVDRLIELFCAEVLRDKLPEETVKNSVSDSSSS